MSQLIKSIIGRIQSIIDQLVFASQQRLNYETQMMSLNPNMSRYSIGKFSYGSPAPLVLYDPHNPRATLRIGNFCSIAEDVTILLGWEHRTDWVTTYPFRIFFEEFKHFEGTPATKGDVTIGNDVWIGRGAFILSGVTIGDGAVVGASSVVAKNVAPYTIVAGNPARVIRQRFDQETIDKLLQIKWWDWNIQRIKENMPLLLSNRIGEFIEKNNESLTKK